jgi:hypothetical protein
VKEKKKNSSSISLFMKVTIHGTHCSISLAGNMLKKLGSHSQGKQKYRVRYKSQTNIIVLKPNVVLVFVSCYLSEPLAQWYPTLSPFAT